MALLDCSRMPGATARVTLNDECLRLGIRFACTAKPNGQVAAGPPWCTVVVRMPVMPGGDSPLHRIAAAAADPQWTTQLDRPSEWVQLKLTLDVPGWNVTYDCERVLIDGCRLEATPEGFEEVLTLRAFRVVRKRNSQNRLPLTMDGSGAG